MGHRNQRRRRHRTTPTSPGRRRRRRRGAAGRNARRRSPARAVKPLSQAVAVARAVADPRRRARACSSARRASVQPAAQEPVPGQGVDHPQGVVVVVVERGVQGGAQVGGLGVQAPEPGPLVVAAKAWCRPFGEIGVVTAVPHPQPARFPRLLEALQAIGRDALQQPVPGASAPLPPVRPVRHHDKRAIYQPGQQAQHIQAVLGADRLRRGQAAAVRGYRQPPQHQPFRVGEQLPAPVDDGPQGLLPRRGVAGTGDQQPEPVVEPREELVHAQGPDAGRRQFQRQRNPVEPPAQPGDSLGVTLIEAETRRGRRRPYREQLYGAEPRQAARSWSPQAHRPEVFTGHHEGFPAGHQDAQLGSGPGATGRPAWRPGPPGARSRPGSAASGWCAALRPADRPDPRSCRP